jgi:hypothetical protein
MHTGRLTAASALAGIALPHVHAAKNNTIQVALIGCRRRGTGAASQALSTRSGPIKWVALGDVFQNRVRRCHEELKQQHPTQVDAPEDRRFVGFDAYKNAMDCLKPGDVAVFASPPAFRWVHFTYAPGVTKDREY